MKIYNLVVPQQGKGERSYWREVGTMFVEEDKRINLKLYMFPELNIQAYPREESKRGPRTPQRRGPINQNPAPEVFTEDEVPF